MKTDPMTPIDRLRNDNSVVCHFLCVCVCVFGMRPLRWLLLFSILITSLLLYIFIYPFFCYRCLFLSISKCVFAQRFFVFVCVPFSMKPIDIARGADDTLFQKKRTDAAATALTTSLQILSALDLFLLITLYNSWKQTVHVLHDEQ